jgi:hypothetical protein
MWLAILRARSGNGSQPSRVIDFAPSHGCYLVTALARQDEKLDHRTKGPSNPTCSQPNKPKFFIR